MRIAIISDIHGNSVALETVLNDLRAEHIDRVVCLGDTVADGPQPREVLGRLKAEGCEVVKGNMDDWFLDPPQRSESPRRFAEIQYWGVSQLPPDDFAYLHDFLPTVVVPLDNAADLLCYHGSPRSNTEGIGPTTSDEDLEQMLSGHRAAVLAGGHTHRQMIRQYGDVTILNPGSVGAPPPRAEHGFHRARAEYGIVVLEEDGFRIELRRTALDLDRIREAVRSSGMPHADWWVETRYPVLASEQDS